MGLLLLVLHLNIRKGCPAHRAPVDDALALIDQALFIQPDKHLPHRPGAALVQGEALPAPVAAGAHAPQLLGDAPAVFLLPLPGPLQKALPPQVFFADAFFFHLIHNPGLGGDGGVVRARQPQGGIPQHPVIADEDVLHGGIPGVAHVELSCDVGRGHHDAIGLFFRVHLGDKDPRGLPGRVGLLLHLLGVIGFRHFECLL